MISYKRRIQLFILHVRNVRMKQSWLISDIILITIYHCFFIDTPVPSVRPPPAGMLVNNDGELKSIVVVLCMKIFRFLTYFQTLSLFFFFLNEFRCVAAQPGTLTRPLPLPAVARPPLPSNVTAVRLVSKPLPPLLITSPYSEVNSIYFIFFKKKILIKQMNFINIAFRRRNDCLRPINMTRLRLLKVRRTGRLTLNINNILREIRLNYIFKILSFSNTPKAPGGVYAGF